MNVASNVYLSAIVPETTPGTPASTVLNGTFTVAAVAASSNTTKVTVNTQPYLDVVVCNGTSFIFVKDASEVVPTGYSKVLTGATPTAAATALTTSLAVISGITVTSAANVVTISSSLPLTVSTIRLQSDVQIGHTEGVDEVWATGNLAFTGNPSTGQNIQVGAEVFEFYTSIPYVGAEVGVLVGATLANTLVNLAAAINTAALPNSLLAVVGDNAVMMSAKANVTVTTTATNCQVTSLTGYVAPATSVSTIRLNSNLSLGDTLNVGNGSTSVSLAITTGHIGATQSATATLIATALSTAGFPAAAVGAVVTVTYGAAFGEAPDEPVLTPSQTMNLLSTVISTTETGAQLLVSGLLQQFANYYRKGQAVTTRVGSTFKEWVVISFSSTTDSLVVKPVNNVMDTVGTVYSVCELPPILEGICLTGGGLTVATEKAESECLKQGLMSSVPFVSGYTPTLSLELTMRDSPTIMDLIAGSIHSPGINTSLSLTLTATLSLVTASSELNTYRVNVTVPSLLNNAKISELVVFRMSGWADTKKNMFPFSFSAITASGFEFKTPRLLTPETATINLVTANWMRNGTTPKTFNFGQYDGFEYNMAYGASSSGFEVTASGADAVKLTIPAVVAGGVSRNPRPSIQNGLAFPYWLYIKPESNAVTYISKRSFVYLNDKALQATEPSVKVNDTHIAESTGVTVDDIDSDVSMFPSSLMLQNVKPTVSFKTPKSKDQFGNIEASEGSCAMSVVFRFVAKSTCQGAKKANIILVHVPYATVFTTPDSPTTKGQQYVAWEGTGGEYVPMLVQSNNNKEPFAIQISYFPQQFTM